MARCLSASPQVRVKTYRFVNNIVLYVLNTFVNKIPFHAIRLSVYRMIYPIGRKSAILLNVRFCGSRVRIGDNVIVNSFAHLDGRGAPLIIGDGADIGCFVKIWTLEHDPNSPTNETRAGAVTISKDAWVASGSTILPGITIGEGAVVASGSVVTHDVLPRVIVAGNPARQVGIRHVVPERARKLRYLFE